MSTSTTTPRMPVIFAAHGAPMLLDDEAWATEFDAWSADVTARNDVDALLDFHKGGAFGHIRPSLVRSMTRSRAGDDTTGRVRSHSPLTCPIGCRPFVVARSSDLRRDAVIPNAGQ